MDIIVPEVLPIGKVGVPSDDGSDEYRLNEGFTQVSDFSYRRLVDSCGEFAHSLGSTIGCGF